MLNNKNLGLFIIASVAFLSLISLIHRSKPIADLGELNQVTELPANIKDVLAWPAPKSINVPILMYHYVEYVTDKRDTIRQSLDIYPST